MSSKLRSLAGLAALAFALSAPAAERANVVVTAGGAVKGTERDGVLAFLGVPYAKPPVGPLRWRSPEPAVPWSGERDATRFAPSCYQPPPVAFGPYTGEFLDTPAPSEDCLYLNVWAPSSGARDLPVLVWIHGGGFTGGSGALDIYNGSRLAAKGAVVVTINYRLGPFGFLALPALSAESGAGSGTYGLQDIIAALRWVRRSIAAFGGDPDKVTVAGQSAGAIAVNELLLAPSARGLFARAIAESGSGMGVGAPRLADAERTGERLLAAAGAADLAALRALPADKILTAAPAFAPKLDGKGPPAPTFIPVQDGAILPDTPDHAATAAVAPVPLMTGYNADEARRPGQPESPADFEDYVRGRYGAMAERFLALYPHRTAAEAADSMEVIARDRSMASLVIFAEQRSGASGQPVYAYLFTHPVPVAQPPGWGTFHTGEVPYLFDMLDTSRRPYGAEDDRIADQISAYWLGFMRTGVPGGDGMAPWPAVRSGTGEVMMLGDRVASQAAVSSAARLQAFRDFVAGGETLSLF